MADITIRNPAVALSDSRAEGQSALKAVRAVARTVVRGLRSFVAAMEPAKAETRLLSRGFDR